MPMLFKLWFRRFRRVSRNRHIQRITVAGFIVLGAIALNSACFYYFEKAVKARTDALGFLLAQFYNHNDRRLWGLLRIDGRGEGCNHGFAIRGWISYVPLRDHSDCGHNCGETQR